MAEKKQDEEVTPGRAHAQTEVHNGPISTVDGETSPAADQSNRESEMAARMAVTPAKTLDDQKKAEQERKNKEAAENGGEVYPSGPVRLGRTSAATEFDDEDKPTKFVDPDELEAQQVNETFPTTICQNCKNHGRGEVKLDKKGFCERCGFKLNRVSNRALEPAQK